MARDTRRHRPGEGPPRPPPRPVAEDAPSPPEPVRMSGWSMGVKVAMATAFAVAVASGVLVIVASNITNGEVDREVNGAGERLIKFLAAIDVPVWKEIHQHTTATLVSTRFQQVAARLRETLEATGAVGDVKDRTTAAREEAVAALGAFQTQLVHDAVPGPLERMGTPPIAKAARVQAPEVLDLFVYEKGKDQPFMSFGSYAGRPDINLGGRHVVQPANADGLEISEGTYSLPTGNILARTFKRPIRDAAGDVTGSIVLCLKAQQIREVQNRLMVGLLIAGAIALLVGAAIGLIFSSTLVRPIKTLLSDIQIVAAGDLDHTTKAHSGEEIGLLARAFNLMTRNLKAGRQKELENKALEHELNIASEIQSNLLPKRIPRLPGWDVGAFYRPSKEVGGDYYDFIQIDDEHLGIVVADVSGKGIPGSMVMTMARSLLRMEAERNLSTADTLLKTNRILARDIRRGMFVTCLYMILNVRTKSLQVASGGHNPLVIVRHATKTRELVNPNGIALGFDKGPIFERTIQEQRLTLQPGDRLIAYTDGVVESMSPEHEEFGDDKFFDMCQALAAKTSNEFITSVVEALDRHQASGPQHDDITIVTVRLLP